MPDVAIDRARSGDLSARSGAARLQSAVDPAAEARRFAEALGFKAAPAAIVTLGPCVDYLSPALARLYPASRIVAIQLSGAFADLALPGGGRVPTWHPGRGESLDAFLAVELGEEDCEGLEVVAWPPATKAGPEAAQDACEAIARFVREGLQSITTRGAFGPRWTLNAARNLLRIEGYAVPRRAAGPAFVAASGPGLERARAMIAGQAGKANVVAVASALEFLAAARLRPTIAVATDGGWYARLLLRALPDGVPLAMPLSAAPPPAPATPVIALAQGLWQEDFLARAAGISTVSLRPHGTVTGSAFALARALGFDPLLVAGLDLAALDVRGHARPHAFDAFIARGEGRTEPYHARLCARAFEQFPLRAGAWRRSPAMESYGRRFADAGRMLPRADAAGGGGMRALRIFPSPFAAEGLADADGASLAALLGGAGGTDARFEWEAVPAPPPARRKEAVAALAADLRRRAAESAAAVAGGGAGGILAEVDAPALLRARKARRRGDGAALGRELETALAGADRLAGRLEELAR